MEIKQLTNEEFNAFSEQFIPSSYYQTAEYAMIMNHQHYDSMLIGAIFEYLCSLFQEKAFGTVSWEYSDTFLNFAGRTNLFYAIAWGFLGLFWMKIGFPIFGSFLEKIPKRIAIPITTILLVFMIFNLTISSMAAIREQERRHRTSSRY